MSWREKYAAAARARGFALKNTGGGVMCYQKQTRGGRWYALVSPEDPDEPEVFAAEILDGRTGTPHAYQGGLTAAAAFERADKALEALAATGSRQKARRVRIH